MVYLIRLSLVLISSLIIAIPSIAAEQTVNLDINYKEVNFAGKQVQALAVNDQIPGPLLHFKQGDHVTINVYNHLKTGTSIHWHGLIVPWQMDGVAEVSQKPIPPGSVFHYQFTLNQAGSYWYHAHTGLQEQEGLYGAFIIDPTTPTIKSDKDFSVILSDWSNTKPETIYANLKKEGDYYSAQMPLQASLTRFWQDYQSALTMQNKQNILQAYKGMQQMRMSVYDISDVAYDTFLMNGHPPENPWTAQVAVGDTVRLRFVGAGASTIFHVKIPGLTLSVVQVDGNNVKPYSVESLAIAPGETYDVLVTISKNKPAIIYAQSIDKIGAALGALLTQKDQPVDYSVVPAFADPQPASMMNQGAMASGSKPMSSMSGMKAMPKKPVAVADLVSTSTQYDPLQATEKTNDPTLPVQAIRIDLTGYMDRYIWTLNGIPEYKAEPIMIEHGKRYRIIFTNKTMMHHPMHIHGHWFILRNGHGAYDPLLHTIDVPPGATVVADVDADTSGQWYFHCHNLYHMKAGMGTIFRYQDEAEPATKANTKSNTTITKEETDPSSSSTANYLPGHKQVPWYYSQIIDLNGDFAHDNYQASAIALIGPDDYKLLLNMENAEINDGIVDAASLDIFAWHLLNQYWALKGGVNYNYRPAVTPYFQPGVGIEGLMPYFIITDLRSYYHEGSTIVNLSLSRDTQLTNRVFLRTEIEGIVATKTVDGDEIGSGLNSLEWTISPYYQLTNYLSIYWQYQYSHNYSSLERLNKAEGAAVSDSSYSVGFTWLV